MSFICATCGKPAPPRVKPTLDAEYRDHIHTTTDEHGQTVEVGRGPQITVEHKLCRPCAHLPEPKPRPVDVGVLKTFANGFAAKHARKCTGVTKSKKFGRAIELPCQTCIDIKATFDAMPANVLSEVLG